MKLALCVPISWEFVPTPFLISFASLLSPGRLKVLRELGVERYFYLFNRSFPLDLNRNQLADKALELGADRLLFLDADMTHPPDLVPALVRDSLESGAALVSALYFKKQPPHPAVSARRCDPSDPQLLTPIDTLDKGLVECEVIGMGAALIHREVFAAVPRPWFEYAVYAKTGERTVTEDVTFCDKARAAGFRLLTDTRLVCGHLRQVEVDESHWLGFRDLVKDQLAAGTREEDDAPSALD